MGKRKLIWSPQSKIDLFEIMNFYRKRNGNPTYSLKLYANIKELLERCKSFSFIGRKTDYENVRVLIADDYLIFYEVTDGEVRVLTIRSAKQNPETLNLKR